MDPDYLLYARIVEAGSLSAAGRALRLSPAMVSKRLSRLEERLGAQLIHRTTRRLATTAAGQIFYEDVAAILAASAAAEARVAGGADEPAGVLRVSVPTSFGRLHVAPYLGAFLSAHSRIALELDLSDGFVDLIGERIDLAIRITSPVGGVLEGRRLAANRRLLCAAPDYLRRHGAPTSLEALAEHRLLAARTQSPWRLEGPAGTRSLDVTSAIVTNSSEVVRELAIAGHGIALRSTWDIGRELASGALVRVLEPWEGARDVAIYAVHPRASLVPPQVRAFVDHLAAIYAPAPPWE